MSEQSTEKILDKIKKLHNQAVNCKSIGSDHEAQAFAEMVTRLLNEHKLEMSDIQFEEQRKSEPVDKHSIKWEDHGLKTKGTRVAWTEHLANFAARAYSCRILIVPGSNRIYLAGTESNRAVAEYVIVTLVRSAEKIADEAYTKYFYECRAKGDVTMARGYRSAFLDGFVDRIRARFEAERARAEASSMALVRFDKEKQDLNDFMAGHTKSAKSMSRHSSLNSAGYKAGAERAESMNLSGNGVKSGHGQKVLG